MKVKRLPLLVASICLVFVFASLSLIAEKALAQPKTYNWKMAAPNPHGHPMNVSIVNFAKTLEERTNGAVKITLYEGVLGSPTDHWDMVTSNTIQLAFLGDNYNSGRMPVSGLVNTPFELPDMSVCQAICNEWLKAGYLKELTDNFKVLYFIPPNTLQLFLRNKKATTMEDLRGLKIRTISGIQGQVISALGATGVSMAGGEVYMALQTGVIDGAITGIDVVVDRKYYEICKYGLKLPIGGGVYVLVMNKETWNSLPKDLQVLIEQVGKDAGINTLKKASDEQNGLWETARKAGMEVYTISSEEQARWKKATAAIADKYVQEWTAKGYPAKEALELMRKVVSKK